jgi:mRNA-degrading endonuclease RelE of RelBE toxin-antitoxin system
MDSFKKFCETKAHDEAEKSLEKLPKGHRDLVKNYKFKFDSGVNLKGYPDSIGLIHLGNPDKKLIQVAAPWNYGREFAMLHEIGHRVYEQIMTKELKKKWSEIAKKNDKRVKQDDEELFCHAYANTYANNKITKHDCPEWEKFIKSIPESK